MRELKKKKEDKVLIRDRGGQSHKLLHLDTKIEQDKKQKVFSALKLSSKFPFKNKNGPLSW